MHGIEQREYVEWKAHMLAECGAKLGNGARPELFSWTRPIFTRLRAEAYGDKNHKNTVTDHHYKYLDLFGLLIWYLDDGTWQQGQLNIKCESFAKAKLECLSRKLNNRYGLDLKVYDYPYTRIVAFRKASRDKVLPVWHECFERYEMPKSMLYKLNGE